MTEGALRGGILVWISLHWTACASEDVGMVN